MLSVQDAEFFSLLGDAAFANPFSDDRDRLDRRLAGARGGEGTTEVFARLQARVRERLRRIGPLALERRSQDERALLETAILFDVFHRRTERFDALIQQQVAAGPKSVRVPFGRETIAEMVSAGIGREEACRHFALFYQLRRAFYFIGQTLPGASPSMRRFRERLWSNVFTRDARLYARLLWRKMEDFSTFLFGETGTGKGIAAAAIGRSGWIPYDEGKQEFAESFVDSFLSINLSQFPEALLESELFGHKKGAFTGAIDGHAGVLSRCSRHGAIFLDEIGEIGAPVQIKLLRVLQERTFSAVGSHEPSRFSGRVIAATNRSLSELRADGTFRDDFYYRLCSDVIAVPSLRARLGEQPGELDALLAFILRRILGEDSSDLHARAREAIDRDVGPRYAWPGNVRELEQCVRSVVLTGGYSVSRPGDAASGGGSSEGERLLDVAGSASASSLVTRYCQALYARHGTYEEVARRTGLDRRTVKSHITSRAPS